MSTGPTPGGSFSQIVHTVLTALADKLAKGLDPFKQTAQEQIKELQQNHPIVSAIVTAVSNTLAQDDAKRQLAEEAKKAARGERPGLTAEESKAMIDMVRNQPR